MVYIIRDGFQKFVDDEQTRIPKKIIWCDRGRLEVRDPIFEAVTGLTAFIDGVLADVFLGCKVNARRSVYSSSVSPHYHPYQWLADMTLGTSGHYQEPEQDLVAAKLV